MSNNRNHNCGFNRQEAIRDLVAGIADIKEGLKFLCKALNDLRCGRDECAERNLVCGIQSIEEGLCKAKEALREIHD